MQVRAIVAAIACCLVAACSQEEAPRRPVTPLDQSTVGTIRGDVRFEGTPPPMAPLPVDKWPGCGRSDGQPVLSGDALVKDGKVQNAFVYLKSGLGDRAFAVPDKPVEIDQDKCVYVPRVVGAQVGQKVLFVNSDDLLHNVHGVPAESRGWNVSLSTKGSSRAITVDKPEVMVRVRCDLHPWMNTFIGVVDHPYFAVTGPDGHFEIPNVPPGDYTVAVWHEKFGTREAKVTLAPKGTSETSFTLTPP